MLKEGTIDADNSDEPTVTSFVNNNVKEGKIDADQWDEPTVTSFVNHKVVEGKISADEWDEPTITSTNQRISSPSSKHRNGVNTNSKNESVFNATPDKMNEFFLGSKNNIGQNQGKGVNNRFFKSINQGVNGDYNTYKFENRFTFKTIGDTERFHNSQSHHDVFTSFRNRYFVDTNDVNQYKYQSFFGTGAGVNGAPKDGRMVGRTRFFIDSHGNITYPSNHYINASTSKDGLLNLIYKGTQHDGSNPTEDPIENDPSPKVSAYTISVGGSDTIKELKLKDRFQKI